MAGAAPASQKEELRPWGQSAFVRSRAFPDCSFRDANGAAGALGPAL